jgi:signal transduction histidine kinase
MLPDDADKPKTVLRNAQTLSINILDDIHKLIYELRPSLLDDLGLVAAIRWLLDNNLSAAGVKISFKATGQVRRLGAALETTLFRVIQEAVNNISRYANAENTDIMMNFRKRIIRVRIKDDGAGFNVDEAISSRDRPRGLGLLGMKERVELVNGTLSIRSYPGGGTEVDFKIPLN